jgi:hypothetical protein
MAEVRASGQVPIPNGRHRGEAVLGARGQRCVDGVSEEPNGVEPIDGAVKKGEEHAREQVEAMLSSAMLNRNRSITTKRAGPRPQMPQAR